MIYYNNNKCFLVLIIYLSVFKKSVLKKAS